MYEPFVFLKASENAVFLVIRPMIFYFSEFSSKCYTVVLISLYCWKNFILHYFPIYHFKLLGASSSMGRYCGLLNHAPAIGHLFQSFYEHNFGNPSQLGNVCLLARAVQCFMLLSGCWVVLTSDFLPGAVWDERKAFGAISTFPLGFPVTLRLSFRLSSTR